VQEPPWFRTPSGLEFGSDWLWFLKNVAIKKKEDFFLQFDCFSELIEHRFSLLFSFESIEPYL